MILVYTTKPPREPLRSPPFYVQDGPLWRPTHTTWPHPLTDRPNAVLVPWSVADAEPTVECRAWMAMYWHPEAPAALMRALLS